MRDMRWAWNLVLMLWLLYAGATLGQAQSPSTPEERARLIAVAHKMENNPLDPALRPEREWAIKWLIEVPDIHLKMCPTILGDYHKYKYSPEITAQLMLSSAAFALENPNKASDGLASYVAGAEGALRAYNSILQQSPGSKSKPLDELAQKQSQGKLKDSIDDAAKKKCQN